MTRVRIRNMINIDNFFFIDKGEYHRIVCFILQHTLKKIINKKIKKKYIYVPSILL